MADGGKIERQQELAISALLVQPTVQGAAQVANIGERTLWRWLKEEPFKRAYREAKREAVAQAVANLQRVSGEAVEALSDVMTNKEAPASARVSAARAVIELSLKAVEIEDLEGRITRLENLTKKAGGGNDY